MSKTIRCFCLALSLTLSTFPFISNPASGIWPCVCGEKEDARGAPRRQKTNEEVIYREEVRNQLKEKLELFFPPPLGGKKYKLGSPRVALKINNVYFMEKESFPIRIATEIEGRGFPGVETITLQEDIIMARCPYETLTRVKGNHCIEGDGSVSLTGSLLEEIKTVVREVAQSTLKEIIKEKKGGKKAKQKTEVEKFDTLPSLGESGAFPPGVNTHPLAVPTDIPADSQRAPRALFTLLV